MLDCLTDKNVRYFGGKCFRVLLPLNVSVLVTALLEWVSEYAAGAYTTSDSTVSYLNHAQVA